MLYKGEDVVDEEWGISTEWEVIGERELRRTVHIEPSESATYRFEFFVPCHVQTVYIYTFFPNDERSKVIGSEVGWSDGVVVDVQTEKPASHADANAFAC